MVKNWHEMSGDEVLASLGTSRKGLEPAVAASRLSEHGPNEIAERKGRSRLSIFLNQFKSLLIIILIFAAIFSIFIGEVLDSSFIILIVVLNAVFGFFQEYKAEKAIAALKKLTTPEVVAVREGREQKIPSRELVPGDIVILDQGSKVPADIRLLEITDLNIDESAITGESIPADKNLKTVTTSNLAERRCIAYMGTMVTYGRGIGVVVDTGMNTEMGSIAHMIQSAPEEMTPLQKSLDVLGKNLGIIILAISGIIALFGILRGFGIINTIMTAIALSVAAIPEGLPAVVTITLALGIQRMSKQNAIMRRVPSVETLGSTTVICSDKTGTLTRNEMVIRKLWYAGKETEVTGSGYDPKGDFIRSGRKIEPRNDHDLSTFLKSSFLCNNSAISYIDSRWEITGDPTEVSFKVAALKAGFDEDVNEKFVRVKEIPFTSERKMMSTVNRISPRRNMVCAKGAPELLLKHCNRMLVNGRPVLLTDKKRKEILGKNTEFTQNALRVLAVAYKEIASSVRSGYEKDLVFVGLAGMIDSPRDGVKRDIMLCREAGIKVVMITGDHRNTALAIGRELGIVTGSSEGVLTGDDLEKMTEKQLENAVEGISIYARVNPEHKVKIVDAFRARGHVIAMTGDGVNDAPALKKADIGVSMGITGTDVAKEASDMVLKDDNFSTIVTAVREGRTIYDNINKFVQYLLSSNFGEVMVVFVAMLIGFTDPATGSYILPLTAIQLLWVNLLTDGFPALALGVDPPEPNIMKRPPRNPKEKILSRKTLSEIVLIGAVMAIGTLFLFWINLPSGSGKAVTVAFTSIILFELIRTQSIRMRYNLSFFSNSKLTIARFISLSLQMMVIYVPFFQEVFGTVPLDLFDWAELAAVAGIILFIMWARTKLFTGKI